MNSWVLILIFAGGYGGWSPAGMSAEFSDKESCQAAYTKAKEDSDYLSLKMKGFCVKKGIRQ